MKMFKSLGVLLVSALFAVVAMAGDPYEVTSVRNSDTVGFVERVDQYIAEMAMSESADAGGAVTFDIARIESYNAALDAYYAWVQGETGKIDIPYSYPTDHAINYVSNSLDVEVENKGMRDLLRLYLQLMEQQSKSASANDSNGVNDHDYERYLLGRAKIDSYLQNYIAPTNPLDLPEYNGYRDDVTNPSSWQITPEDRARFGPLARPRPVAPGASVN